MQHLDEGTVHAWLDGALPTTEAREAEHHIAECSECSAMVAEARGLIAGASRIVSSLDVVRGNVIPKTPAAGAGKSLWHSLHLTPARAALAATLMIAVSTLLTVRHDTAEKMVQPIAAFTPSATPSNASATADAGMRAPAPTPAAPPAAVPTVANSAPVKDAPAAVLKDRAEVASKPKAEARADVATSAIAAAPPVVQTPPPATAAAGASAISLDTTLKKTLAKVAEVDSLRTMQVQTRQPARQFATRSVAPPLNTACFQFAEPPAPGLPHRFALQLLPGDTSQHIVRAVNESGRIDSLLAGSSWTRSTPTEITVRFASNDRTVTLPVPDATLGAAVSITAEERSRAARQAGPSVNRVECRP